MRIQGILYSTDQFQNPTPAVGFGSEHLVVDMGIFDMKTNYGRRTGFLTSFHLAKSQMRVSYITNVKTGLV